MEKLNHLSDIFILGMVLCLIGVFICYQIGSRRFKRRGAGGLQYFGGTYGKALATTVIEKCLNAIGIVIIIIGIFFILIDRFNNQPTTEPTKPKTIIHSSANLQ
jgi:hypothetical protein